MLKQPPKEMGSVERRVPGSMDLARKEKVLVPELVKEVPKAATPDLEEQYRQRQMDHQMDAMRYAAYQQQNWNPYRR